MDTAIDPKDSMLKPIVLKPISVTDLDGSEALFSKKLSDVLVAFTNPLNGRSVVKDRSECNKYGLNSYMAGMTGSTNPLVGWNGDSLQFGAPDALILFPVMIRDIAIQEADDGGGGFGKDRAVNTQSSSEDSYESGIMPHRRRSHTQATSDASGPLEPFPDLKETDLQYTGNTTNGLSSTAVYGRYPGQGGDHPNGYSHGAQIKEPHTCSNFAAPAGNTRIMSGTSDYPTRGAGAGSVASMVDPSLQAGVYHAVTRVTSRTSVPTLDPRGGEPVRFYPRGIDTIHQDEESPTSDGPHNAKSCQSMDSQGIIEHDTDVAFRKTPVNQPPRDYPSPQNLLSEPAHAAGEPSNGASTVQTVPPTHKHQAGESTKKDLNSVSTGVPGEASGGPHRGATSVAAGVRASLRAFEEKAKRISERRKEARERRENIRRLLAEYRWNPEPNQPERTPPGPAPLVTAPRESPSPKSPSPKSPSPGPTGAEPTASEHVASERVASDPPAPEPAPLETAPRESPSPKSTSPGSTRAVPTASKVIASEQVAPEHVALVSPVSDAPASEPAPQSRPTTMRTPPSRRRATTSSDEAVCCICDCFGSLRSVCCGRKPTRYSPILLEQRRADTVAASDTRMTENRVTEYLEQLEDHYSLRASEASFYQREDGRTPQNSVRPRSHGRESSRSATNAAPATSVQDVAQSRDEHAEKRSVTAPPQRS